MRWRLGIWLLGGLVVSPAMAEIYTAGDTVEAQSFINAAVAGDTVLLRPGVYDSLEVVNKTTITVRSLDSADPAVIRPSKAGDIGLYIGHPVNVTVADLALDYTHLVNATNNGIHVDAANQTTFGDGLTLRNLSLKMTAPLGNVDGLHMSGVNNYTIENCRFENWGQDGGGIDIIGGQTGIIRNNLFKGTYPANGSGVTAKGGARNVIIRANRFETAGGRAISIGGLTDPDLFEPGINFEAKDLIAEGNVILNGFAPVAFTSSDGGEFRYNVSFKSGRWAGRILREQTAPGFVNVRNGKYLNNRIIWDQGDLSPETINYSDDADYASFIFANNQWYNRTNPAGSVPTLPPGATETDGSYGADPGVDVNRIVPWSFDWGMWLVNATLTDDTFLPPPMSPEPLMLAVPGAGATFDPSAAFPLSGSWSYQAIAGSVPVIAMMDAVLIRQSLVPEPGLGLLAIPMMVMLRRRRLREASMAASQSPSR